MASRTTTCCWTTRTSCLQASSLHSSPPSSGEYMRRTLFILVSYAPRVHRICKNYPLPSFGSLHWIVLELSAPRSHTPLARRPRLPSGSSSQYSLSFASRGRSSSFDSTPSPPEVFSADCADPSLFAPETVFFDLAQSYSPIPPTPAPTSPSTGRLAHSHSQFFQKAPQRLLLSLLSLRTRHLFTPVDYNTTLKISIVFNSNRLRPSSSSWSCASGLMMVLDDGEIDYSDPWLIGGAGQHSFVPDRLYAFTLSHGLAGEGLIGSLPATFRKLRLVRQSPGKWTEEDLHCVSPRAVVTVVDGKDSNLGFSLGPIVFEPSGVDGNEWAADMPTLIQY